MQDTGTIHLRYGHHEFHLPLAYYPVGVDFQITRGSTNAHCGHNPHPDRIEVVIEGKGITIRGHVAEEFITLNWQTQGNFVPEAINLT